jgi:hypothetical protein
MKSVIHSDLTGNFQEVFEGEIEYIRIEMNDSITTEYIHRNSGEIDTVKSRIVWIDDTSCYSFLYHTNDEILQYAIHPNDTCLIRFTHKKGDKIFFETKNTTSKENTHYGSESNVYYRKGYLKKIN